MTAHVHHETTPAELRTLGSYGSRVTKVGLIAGIALLGAAIAFAVWDGHYENALRAYLVGYCFVVSVCLGGLFFVMLQHLTKAGWSVVIRRIAEGLAGNLKWIWIGFLPILWGMWASEQTQLYFWATDAAKGDEVLQLKAGYLEPIFWTIRSGVYFLIWGLLAWYFLRNSFEQDQTGDPQLTQRMQAVAAPGMILYALTQSFAAIDWIMTLEAHWFSTMFGVYFFAASSCGMFATLILIAFALQKTGRVKEINAEHFQDLGKLLFAFGVVFWAYIAFSQFMLIWYANLPEETTWFIGRILGDWEAMSYLLIVAHFILPFLAIISKHPKRQPALLAIAAGWMLFMNAYDMYWLIMPHVPGDAIAAAESLPALKAQFADQSIHFSLLHPLCVLGLSSLVVAGAAWSLRGRPLIPEQDPRLHESLAFENM